MKIIENHEKRLNSWCFGVFGRPKNGPIPQKPCATATFPFPKITKFKKNKKIENGKQWKFIGF